MDAPQDGFLDVPALLESSMPRPRVAWLGYGIGAFLLLVLAAALAGQRSAEAQAALRVFSALAMLLLMGVLGALTVLTVRRHRAEQEQLEAAAELVQLRRWPQAAFVLEHLLSTPARAPQLRAQALVYLAAVLARYHRFDDAIAVYNHLLDPESVDDATAYGLRLGRAMAMLREDHLFDADRAINELRRGRGRDDSAGLALVELYRDVKTGHPAEAVQLFEAKLPSLRDALGHRVADAWALAARAYDLLGRKVEAQDAFTKATLLAPPAELFRRYPEVEKLAATYAPAIAPLEMR
jgi:tetratricopeptide (TPR) repeat protein